MKKTIQTTLDGEKSASNGNGRNFRLEEVFVAGLLLAKIAEGDTYRDILKKISKYAPMIRWNNEAMIRKVLQKLDNFGIILMIDTHRGLNVAINVLEAETEASELIQKISKFGDFFQ